MSMDGDTDPKQLDRSTNPTRKPDSLEYLAGLFVVSVLFTAYGMLALQRDDLFVPTRVRGEHLYGNDAIAFLIVLVLAVIANGAKLLSCYYSPTNDGELFRFGKGLARVAIYGYILYMLSGRFTAT